MTPHQPHQQRGLPVPNPTVSYWQASFPDSPIHHHGRHDPLPPKGSVADVAIIGSGMSGAVAAYNLQQQAPNLNIVLVEAREACSGATGRNGGHCRPDSFLGFEGYSKLVGKEQAHEVLVNEWDTFNYIRETIEREQIDCSWWQGLTLSVYLDEEIMQKGKRNFESYRSYTDIRPDVRFVEDANEARQLSRIPEAIGAAVFPAGSFYPLRFIHAILSLCLKRGHFQLFTHTAVQALERERGSSHWTLQTSRGSFSAKKVLVATNGYSRALLPSLDDFLLSHRAHCSSIIPPPQYRQARSLASTCSIVRSEGDYEYLVQRPAGPTSDNAFILGGGNMVIKREDEVDTYDDSYLNPLLPDYLSAYPERKFDGWKAGSGQLTHAWTGIQGYTRDSLPLVGPSWEQEGLYLNLGHHGHGMARAATCARGVAQLILSDRTDWRDEEWEDLTKLPSSYRWTESRAKRRDVDCRYEF